MKANKPEDEKYFKDIVLNSILEEIANENGDTLQKTSSKPKKRIKRWVILLPLVAIFATVSVALLTPNTNNIAVTTPKPVITPQPVKLPIEKPKPKETKQIVQQQPSKLMIQKKDTSYIIVLPKATKTSPKQIQQSERERAKAALLQQMKN